MKKHILIFQLGETFCNIYIPMCVCKNANSSDILGSFNCYSDQASNFLIFVMSVIKYKEQIDIQDGRKCEELMWRFFIHNMRGIMPVFNPLPLSHAISVISGTDFVHFCLKIFPDILPDISIRYISNTSTWDW